MIITSQFQIEKASDYIGTVVKGINHLATHFSTSVVFITYNMFKATNSRQTSVKTQKMSFSRTPLIYLYINNEPHLVVPILTHF